MEGVLDRLLEHGDAVVDRRVDPGLGVVAELGHRDVDVLGRGGREVVVGLGIIVAILRKRPSATADDLSLLKG